MLDYYKILGINKNATLDDICNAYKTFAINWKSEDIKSFMLMSSAYDVLSNDVKKVQYDGSRIHTRIASLDEAWEIFSKFILFRIRPEQNNVVRLLGMLEITTELLTFGKSGAIAISAITASLLYNNQAILIYRELNEAEKIAFQHAILILSKSKFLH